MKKFSKKIYDWAAQKALSPLAPLWLGLVFLLEMVFFLPLDGILMLFCLENPKMRHIYALVAAIASTICGIVGYFLGLLLWDAIGPYVVGFLISEEFFNRLMEHYNHYENWAVLIGSFLPVPFKAISLSAGFCKLQLFPFIVCVFAARAARFFIIAEAMNHFGVRIKSFIDRHFNRIVVAVGAKLALGIAFLWALGR